jgi:DNA ligase-1
MSALSIRFQRGAVFLPQLGLWLDAHDPQLGPERVFVSHAHSDHTGLHREVILSEPTSRLMHARIPGQWLEQVMPFGVGRDFVHNDTPFRITLTPAGHIFGSAMSLIESGGKSLLYTGDFKLRKGLSAEACEPLPADILVMETTYGRPVYRFPPTADVMTGVIRFCREALDNEETPVLLGYSLGKSQEILCALGEAGLPLMLHGTVHKLTKVYEGFGQCFPAYESYNSATARGKVLLCPPSVANSAMLRNLGRVRVAVLTGWAVEPNCRFRSGAHAAFPISDHADYPDLIALVKKVSPKKIYTLHGFAADFAQALRELGFDAEALSEQEQLGLPLNLSSSVKLAARRKIAAPDPNPAPAPQLHEFDPLSFEQFARRCAQTGSTTKKLEKVRIVAEYLRELDSSAAGLVSVWLTGVPFASSQQKVLQLGWALIRDALCEVGGLDDAQFGQVYLKHSDLGETAFEILSMLPPRSTRHSVAEIDTLFHQLHSARGPSGKLPLLVKALRASSPLEGKFVLKILTGDLRIGLKEGLVEEAVARAFSVSIDEVKNANLLLGNIGETAQLAIQGQLNSVTLLPFRPIKYMLASPEETAADIWKRVQEWGTSAQSKKSGEEALPNLHIIPPTVWIEDKYDGIRAQIHKVGTSIAIYSRDLKEITQSFSDLSNMLRALNDDFIIDGEIIAMRGEQILPFSELQKRLGRREGDLFLGEQLPIQFFAFDLLWRNGETFLNKPLRERREVLSTLSPSLRLAQISLARSSDEVEGAFAGARGRGNEGLVIKDPASVYTPGRRGLAWLKLKKAFATLDCVVVGAEYGHGKRKSVLSDYTFAIRDELSGELKTIGKAYTGLTDAEIARLTQHFLRNATAQQGRYYAVKPDTVLEIAFDLLQLSDRHTSGLAMRFPRIVRIRTDKSAAEIDTLSTARRLLKS